MFHKSSLHIVHDVRTKQQQEVAMTQRSDSADTHFLEDLAGMVALIVLLVVGLHLPLFA